MKRHLVHPGGFVKTTLLSRKFEVADPRCWFCLNATAGPWWFHYESRRVVCTRCLPDPWADLTPKARCETYVGPEVAARLLRMEWPGDTEA